MTKKYIAPFIVTICIVLYYFIIGVVLLKFDIPAALKIAAVLFSCLITIAAVKVLIERIKEIKSGVEDDLGNY